MEETEKLIQLLKEEIKSENIKKCIVASTTGKTAILVQKELGNICDIIVVRKHYGAKEKNVQEMDGEKENYLKKHNVKIITATHIFGGIGKAIRKAYGTWEIDEIISGVLRLFGIGVKVAIEVSMMSVDAGFVDSGEKVVALGGEKSGASAAVVLNAVNTSDFFNMNIEKIIKN